MADLQHPPKTIYLKDYTAPDYRIEQLSLQFELSEQETTVTSTLTISADYDQSGGVRPLRLDGADLQLISITLNDQLLTEADYSLEDEALLINSPPANFTLEVITRINPSANTALEGLYTSSGNFCTQCEAEGFRKITYFPDRPDVLTVYTTRIVADKASYPVLLSNGNLLEQGELDDGRHFAVWHDPFPKPSYLFALVAGDLAAVEDSFTTQSGREVAIRFYVQHGNEAKCDHAVASLKRAMHWDEQMFGREYDLDIYMVVAVDDFNMGAMENKGLNVFNSCFVLAQPESATDLDFVRVEAVIGHEYFHNWSGNRVTCRDWFQLSLKEGFTVFRDQQFTADMTARAVKRIDDVRVLRGHQFQEDAGPMSHPVRPDSYVEINNFYTLTVYNKGAEVVRMIHTLLGDASFRKGSDLYFERHDGEAVTTEDFIAAMEDASGADLSQFKRWYSQSGTPEIVVERSYDAEQMHYTLNVKQSCPPTAGQSEKQPFHVPLKMALLDTDGEPLPLQLKGEAEAGGIERVLDLTESEQQFTFINIPPEPVPSLLRGFSAPVKLKLDLSDQELAFLMGNDGDDFNRWDAGQQLSVKVMLRLLQVLKSGLQPTLDDALSSAFGKTLTDHSLDPALVAEALTLPAEGYVAEFVEVVDPQAIHVVREYLRRSLAFAHREALIKRYDELTDDGPYSTDAAAMGRRRLRNLCMSYLVELGNDEVRNMALNQFQRDQSMTDVMAALTALVHSGSPEQHSALSAFYERWKEDPLVLDKWFAVQASSPIPGVLDQVRALTNHDDFHLTNPNRVRSLVGTFCMRNPVRFHEANGSGYRFLADWVIRLNSLNPQIAARMLSPLGQWRRYDEGRQEAMKSQLARILEEPSLSKDVFEIASKSLKG
ncbi:aminopeptidase N [Solemya pervernicosa gill symbiont]|uniref:Aminopeptidase N n=2 Tax=Gammaproteobacteria incertae sedis TaxID=118884 RepID=A0A1T2L1J0_9GAMM|nr:aminopeptidase N [Candidatus Reidiella endopervernicosa]OOZ38934.1 aminopeptidase N [Solemya pervernicosa gill symbiont]QKQ26832.1 aminopeptidase N [Candidatus Reidiella endopervernicosa]